MSTERAERPWSRTAALLELIAFWAGPFALLGLYETAGHDAIPLGSVVDVEQPALIGRLIPGSPWRIGAAQFSGNGRSLYVRFAGGVCDALWSATASQPTDDQVFVDLRVGTRLCLGAVPAVAVFYAARMDLANPINPANPPRVVDASTGESVPIAVPPG